MGAVTEVRFVMSLGNGRIVRPSLYFGYAASDTPVPAGELQELADDAYDIVGTSGLMANFTTALTFRWAEAQNFRIVPAGTEEPPPNPDGKLEAETITFQGHGDDIIGSIAADTLPPRNATIYMWNSTLPGTSGRNWTNWPPLAETEVNSAGTIGNTRLNQLNQDLNEIIGTLRVSPTVACDLVVVSRKLNTLTIAAANGFRSEVRTRRRWSTV